MCDNLGAAYSSDVDGKQLCKEILDCTMLVSSRATQNYRVLNTSWHSLLNMMKAPFQIASQIMLTIAVSIASWEKLIFYTS